MSIRPRGGGYRCLPGNHFFVQHFEVGVHVYSAETAVVKIVHTSNGFGAFFVNLCTSPTAGELGVGKNLIYVYGGGAIGAFRGFPPKMIHF